MHEPVDLGGKFSSGDECYPLKVTLGDFLQITEQPGFDTKRRVLHGHGARTVPLRAVSPYLKSVLTQIGYPEVTICQPSTEKGYSDFGESRRCLRGACGARLLRPIFVETPPEVTPV